MNKKILTFYILVVSSFFASSAKSQDNTMSFLMGYSIARYDMPMVDKLISEQNRKIASNSNNLLGYEVTNYYTHPKNYNGFMFGFVAGSKYWANSIGFSTKSITTYSDGYANITTTDNAWATSLKFRHTNFFYQIQFNLIPGKYFQSGPGLGADFSFLSAYVKNGAKLSHQAFVEKSNSFSLDGTAFYGITVGKKFQVFVKPYIQYSLFKYSLWDLESYLNTDPEFTKEEMKFRISNMGITFGIGFGK